MTAIDDLLAQSLLIQDQDVPCDVVPYEDTVCPALAPDGTLRWESRHNAAADDSAAQQLKALCEAAVAHCTADQLADFLTDQVPQPHSAWILGCILHIAGAEDGARFWWQYAAGADDPAASYSLHLHHLALGDHHAAAFWQTQAGARRQQAPAPTAQDTGNAPAHDLLGDDDTNIPTVLRVLSRLTRTAPRTHSETATALIAFVAAAVAIGYDRNPQYEIPLPGPDFAEHIAIIIAATTATRRPGRTCTVPAQQLPNRLSPQEAHGDAPGQRHTRKPERVLVEVTATDGESASDFFKEAVAVCWEAATAARAALRLDERGSCPRYYLEWHQIRDNHRPTPHARAAHKP